MSDKKFFVTTPIYYSNDIPHVGHSYSTFIADVYARFYRLLGYAVKFSTGVDENSQKIVQKAAEQGVDLYAYLDDYAAKHQAVRDGLGISYTDFVRTTKPEHHAVVQGVLQNVYDQGEYIYQGEYIGNYCVGCEMFKKDNDLVEADGKYPDISVGEKVCPLHPNKHLEHITEKNRFFKLSKYQQFLEDLYSQRPDFVVPGQRFNEVKAFVEQGLEDFSISREGKTFGIPLPFDPQSVAYVWYDALLNYVSICQRDGFWSADTLKLHVLGKDISRFHAIYRPAMLQGAGLPLPDKEIVTGFFTLDGQKISKSLGNAINPVDLVQEYGRDALVFYMLYDIPIGSDGDFSTERFRQTYDAILVNAWGNLVNRVVTLCQKNGIQTGKASEKGADWFAAFDQIQDVYLSGAKLQLFIQERYKIIQKANEYMQAEQPWMKLKEESSTQEGLRDLQFLLWVVKQLALLSAPILVEGFAKLQKILGNPELFQLNTAFSEPGNDLFQKLLDQKEFAVVLQPEILYPRK